MRNWCKAVPPSMEGQNSSRTWNIGAPYVSMPPLSVLSTQMSPAMPHMSMRPIPSLCIR